MIVAASCAHSVCRTLNLPQVGRQVPGTSECPRAWWPLGHRPSNPQAAPAPDVRVGATAPELVSPPERLLRVELSRSTALIRTLTSGVQYTFDARHRVAAEPDRAVL